MKHDSVKCSICGLVYTPGQPAECGGDKENLGMLTPEARRFARCVEKPAPPSVFCQKTPGCVMVPGHPGTCCR